MGTLGHEPILHADVAVLRVPTKDGIPKEISKRLAMWAVERALAARWWCVGCHNLASQLTSAVSRHFSGWLPSIGR